MTQCSVPAIAWINESRTYGLSVDDIYFNVPLLESDVLFRLVDWRVISFVNLHEDDLLLWYYCLPIISYLAGRLLYTLQSTTGTYTVHHCHCQSATNRLRSDRDLAVSHWLRVSAHLNCETQGGCFTFDFPRQFEPNGGLAFLNMGPKVDQPTAPSRVPVDFSTDNWQVDRSLDCTDHDKSKAKAHTTKVLTASST
jgi:hypothetical protein